MTADGVQLDTWKLNLYGISAYRKNFCSRQLVHTFFYVTTIVPCWNLRVTKDVVGRFGFRSLSFRYL